MTVIFGVAECVKARGRGASGAARLKAVALFTLSTPRPSDILGYKGWIILFR